MFIYLPLVELNWLKLGDEGWQVTVAKPLKGSNFNNKAPRIDGKITNDARELDAFAGLRRSWFPHTKWWLLGTLINEVYCPLMVLGSCVLSGGYEELKLHEHFPQSKLLSDPTKGHWAIWALMELARSKVDGKKGKSSTESTDTRPQSLVSHDLQVAWAHVELAKHWAVHSARCASSGCGLFSCLTSHLSTVLISDWKN